jgi:hypothetical protein
VTGPSSDLTCRRGPISVWRQLVALGVAVVAAVPLLTGCEAVEDGAAGLTVDSQGHLEGVVHSCHRMIIGVSTSWSENVEPYRQHTVGDWVSPGTRDATIPLSDDPGVGWRATQRTVQPTGSHEYVFAGYFKDENASTRFLTFTASDLLTLRPGRILSDHVVDGKEELQQTTLADFAAGAC